MDRNRTLREGYALVDRIPISYPQGSYYLRFRRNGKQVWESAGTRPDVALVALRNKEVSLQALSLGLETSSPIAVLVHEPSRNPGQEAISVEAAIATYLEKVKRFRAIKTIQACEHILGVFAMRFSGKPIRDISRRDLLDHMFELKGRGLSDRTIYNHIVRIGTLLKVNGIEGLLNSSDKPACEQKDVEAYNADQLAALFAAADPEERETFEFFLDTGMREQEGMLVSWKNIDFRDKVVAIRSGPELGFKITLAHFSHPAGLT